jgi:hypothetical protein
VEVLRGLADAYPADVFPDPPLGQRCTDAGAAYVLRRVAVPWFTRAADSIEALRGALAEAVDTVVECVGRFGNDAIDRRAAAEVARWRALANPLFADAAAGSATPTDTEHTEAQASGAADPSDIGLPPASWVQVPDYAYDQLRAALATRPQPDELAVAIFDAVSSYISDDAPPNAVIREAIEEAVAGSATPEEDDKT